MHFLYSVSFVHWKNNLKCSSIVSTSGVGLVVECLPSKQETRVRFSYAAQKLKNTSRIIWRYFLISVRRKIKWPKSLYVRIEGKTGIHNIIIKIGLSIFIIIFCRFSRGRGYVSRWGKQSFLKRAVAVADSLTPPFVIIPYVHSPEASLSPVLFLYLCKHKQDQFDSLPDLLHFYAVNKFLY